MVSYRVVVTASADVELSTIPFPFRRHLFQRLLKLREDPHPLLAEIKKNGIRSLQLSYGSIDFAVDDEQQRVIILGVSGP
jgi:hypothetical protein